jgi:hypothetical protein
MKEDWAKVFEGDEHNRMSHKLVKKLAGLDPSVDKHVFSFGRHLGITKYGVETILERCLGSQATLEALSDDDSAGEDVEVPAGATKMKKSKKKWKSIGDSEVRQIVGDEVTGRARVFDRWYALQRPLIRPGLITAKHRMYESLNVLLGHVCRSEFVTG